MLTCSALASAGTAIYMAPEILNGQKYNKAGTLIYPPKFYTKSSCSLLFLFPTQAVDVFAYSLMLLEIVSTRDVSV